MVSVASAIVRGAKPVILAIQLVLGSTESGAQSVRHSGQDLPMFMGREITVVEPELDVDGFFPKGPASVCIEGPPQKQCYTAPDDFGRYTKVTVVEVQRERPALLFSAAAGGVSGFAIHFALLRPGKGKELEDLFYSDPAVSDQSQYEFWNDLTISNAPIFLTANLVWEDEGHFEEHRYVISAYVLMPSSMIDGVYYYLEDQYMTARVRP